MKNLFYALFSVALCSCGGGASYTITGNIPGYDSVRLITLDGNATLLAEGVVAEDGAVKLTGKVEAPMAAQLVSGENELAIVLLEAGDIVLTPGQAGTFDVSGTVSNDRMAAFNSEMGELQAAYFALGADAAEEEYQALYDRRTKMITDAVNNNLDNLFGAIQFANGEFFSLTPAQARERIAQFTPQMQLSSPIEQIAGMITAMENTEIGKPFIELSLSNTSGEQISLKSFTGAGKWVLIDFWATWCGPCRGEMPHLKEAYAAYADRGFTIYGVSTDSDHAAWVAFVAENQLAWPNVIDSSRAEGSASDLYGIVSLPTNMLIGPDGTIVAKNLRGEELKTKLAELIK